MKLIVGLGNPGDKYMNNRHNLGFMVVEELEKKIDGGRWKMGVEDGGWKLDKKLKSEIIKTDQVILIKPQTFMNNSGMAIKLVVDYFKIPLSDVIIIHDELDLPLGKIKIRTGGGGSGHHGVESIIKDLDNPDFIRVRLGIGNEHSLGGERGHKHFDANKFVVEDFTPQEKNTVKTMLREAVKTVQMIMEKGIEKAQNQYN